jgi:hypothetical protein
MLVVPVATVGIVVEAMALFCSMLRLWPMCILLNDLSCTSAYILRLLRCAMHCDFCCYQNITMHFVSGALLTMIILICAHVVTSYETEKEEFRLK